jgi:hypothetical protein
MTKRINQMKNYSFGNYIMDSFNTIDCFFFKFVFRKLKTHAKKNRNHIRCMRQPNDGICHSSLTIHYQVLLLIRENDVLRNLNALSIYRLSTCILQKPRLSRRDISGTS